MNRRNHKINGMTSGVWMCSWGYKWDITMDSCTWEKKVAEPTLTMVIVTRDAHPREMGSCTLSGGGMNPITMVTYHGYYTYNPKLALFSFPLQPLGKSLGTWQPCYHQPAQPRNICVIQGLGEKWPLNAQNLEALGESLRGDPKPLGYSCWVIWFHLDLYWWLMVNGPGLGQLLGYPLFAEKPNNWWWIHIDSMPIE